MNTDQRNPKNLRTVCQYIGKARRIRVCVQCSN